MKIMTSKTASLIVALLIITCACIALMTYTYVAWRPEDVSDGACILEPADIAVGPSGTVYVADIWQSCIQKFNADGSFIEQWRYPSDGQDPNSFRPTGIALDSSENLYVTDYRNNRLYIFDSQGTLLKSWGSAGTGDGEFDYPSGVAVDAQGTAYVADTGNNRIQVFDADGTFKAAWGTAGSAAGELSGPFDLALDARGHLFVADTYNHRIQKFSTSGEFITAWGSKGTGEGELNGPGGVWADARGYVFVADTQNNRMQKFDSSGRFIASWASLGEGEGDLFGPCAVTVDTSGSVYVADAKNYRIQKYRPSFGPVHDDGDDEDLCEVWRGTWDVTYGDSSAVTWIIDDSAVRDSNFFPCVASGTASREGEDDIPFKIYSFQGKKFMYTEEVGELDQQMPYTFLNLSGDQFTAEPGGVYDIASGQKRGGT